MSLSQWEKRVLKTPGAAKRVSEIEQELRIAAKLTELREEAGLSQRELAERIGVSQPRVAAIEKAKNVTIDVLSQYATALGAGIEIRVVKPAKKKTSLVAAKPSDRKVTAKRSPRRVVSQHSKASKLVKSRAH